MSTGVERVVVFVQENKTTDFYFPSLAAWGADVQPYGALLDQPPDHDQPHDRNAWVHYAMGDYPAVAQSVDNDAIIPYYSWLAKTFTFCDHHFGAGTNSTPGHLLTFSGQTPTFRNPPFSGPHPVWDLPTVFGLAGRAGRTWGLSWTVTPIRLSSLLSSTTLRPDRASRGPARSPPRRTCPAPEEMGSPDRLRIRPRRPGLTLSPWDGSATGLPWAAMSSAAGSGPPRMLACLDPLAPERTAAIHSVR